MKENYVIDSLDKLKSFCSDYDSEYYVLSYYDNKTERSISFEVVHNPIDVIRNLSKFLEVVKLPLSDVDIFIHGCINSGLISSVQGDFIKVDPKLYYTDLGKKEETNTESLTSD